MTRSNNSIWATTGQNHERHSALGNGWIRQCKTYNRQPVRNIEGAQGHAHCTLNTFPMISAPGHPRSERVLSRRLVLVLLHIYGCNSPFPIELFSSPHLCFNYSAVLLLFKYYRVLLESYATFYLTHGKVVSSDAYNILVLFIFTDFSTSNIQVSRISPCNHERTTPPRRKKAAGI